MNGSNQAMEPTASQRTIHLHMSSTRQSAATRVLTRSRPLTRPLGLESPASASPALRPSMSRLPSSLHSLAVADLVLVR
jgi:hypothetical protein